MERIISYENSGHMLDEGLRRFMLVVYANMGIGLTITAVIGAVIGLNDNLIKLFMGGPQAWVFMLAPLGMVWYISAKINDIDPSRARSLFWVYSAIMGISLSTIFAVFSLGSIAQVFLVTAATFGAMSIWGHTTRADLTKMGSFLIMGVIGILIASLANLFFQSSAASFAISVISVLVFTLLTAYDTQMLKQIYYQTQGIDRSRAGIMGALNLYIDFIAIFVNLLNLVGERR